MNIYILENQGGYFMQKGKIKLKIEVSKGFEDYVDEQCIEQILMRVANRIVSEVRWQIENPNLPEEERFNIDNFNATIECGSGKSGTFAGASMRTKKSTSSSRTFSSRSITHSSKRIEFRSKEESE